MIDHLQWLNAPALSNPFLLRTKALAEKTRIAGMSLTCAGSKQTDEESMTYEVRLSVRRLCEFPAPGAFFQISSKQNVIST